MGERKKNKELIERFQNFKEIEPIFGMIPATYRIDFPPSKRPLFEKLYPWFDWEAVPENQCFVEWSAK